MLLWTLIHHRKQDSYRDNYFFLLILPAFLVAKQLMLERRALPRRHPDGHRPVPRRLPGDAGTHPDPVHEGRVPGGHPAPCGTGQGHQAARLALVCALAAAVRLRPPGCRCCWRCCWPAVFLFWHPQLALRRLDIGIMYLGYAAIVLQLLLDASAGSPHRPGSAPCPPTSSASA
jgi:uncharacterized protein involved in response to NO